jgi:hypothetical protein
MFVARPYAGDGEFQGRTNDKFPEHPESPAAGMTCKAAMRATSFATTLDDDHHRLLRRIKSESALKGKRGNPVSKMAI